jgi:hypothetical protein
LTGDDDFVGGCAVIPETADNDISTGTTRDQFYNTFYGRNLQLFCKKPARVKQAFPTYPNVSE